jgi:hypothetical protein
MVSGVTAPVVSTATLSSHGATCRPFVVIALPATLPKRVQP